MYSLVGWSRLVKYIWLISRVSSTYSSLGWVFILEVTCSEVPWVRLVLTKRHEDLLTSEICNIYWLTWDMYDMKRFKGTCERLQQRMNETLGWFIWLFACLKSDMRINWYFDNKRVALLLQYCVLCCVFIIPTEKKTLLNISKFKLLLNLYSVNCFMFK